MKEAIITLPERHDGLVYVLANILVIILAILLFPRVLLRVVLRAMLFFYFLNYGVRPRFEKGDKVA